MTEPGDLAHLTSQRGWAQVDYERTKWIPCLAAFPAGYDRDRWAREFAAAWWSMSGLPHAENDLQRLAAQLASIHENTYGHIPCHLAFVHLPDPRQVPLPVHLGIWAARNDRDSQLRMLTNADDPNVVRPPIIDEFRTDKLGEGLRVTRFFTDDPHAVADGLEPEVNAGLSYAWRSDRYETDLRLFTASPDLGRLQGAIPDIDELARQISVIPSDS